MESTELFVGETPNVRATIKAPRDNALRVVRAQRAHVGGYFQANLYSDEGYVPGGMPGVHEPRVDDPEDFTALGPGKTTHLNLPVLSRPPKPGPYTLNVILRPTSLKGVKYEATLAFDAKELAAKNILATLPVVPGPDAKFGNNRPKIEILRLKTDEKTHTLFYRRTNGEVMLNRLVNIDPQAKIKVNTQGIDGLRVAGKILISIGQPDGNATLEVDYFTGYIQNDASLN